MYLSSILSDVLVIEYEVLSLNTIEYYYLCLMSRAMHFMVLRVSMYLQCLVLVRVEDDIIILVSFQTWFPCVFPLFPVRAGPVAFPQKHLLALVGHLWWWGWRGGWWRGGRGAVSCRLLSLTPITATALQARGNTDSCTRTQPEKWPYQVVTPHNWFVLTFCMKNVLCCRGV